jgi:lysocardiolipin and lysophospholipid acyltransferase
MYVGWCYGSMIGVISNVVIILKDALRTVPIFGWLMQLGLYIFLRRQRDLDLPHITRMLSYLVSVGSHPSLLLFPEGTDLSESNIAKSNQFAKSAGLPEYQYVLHPKPSGLCVALDFFRNSDTALHDVTLAYEDFSPGKRSTEYDLMTGADSPAPSHHH